MDTFFISDLHLEPAHPELTEFFLAFLNRYRSEMSALYILGDFFEAWIGDDECLPLHEEVAAALSELASSGVRIWLMTGNRDFLMGEAFARRCGATMLPEQVVHEIDGERVLLMHGDSLCTDDTRYQKFRSMTRNPAWQAQVLAQPLSQRQVMARQLRQISSASNREKTMEIMDVNELAVRQRMLESSVRTLVHGHTHRPDLHEVDLNAESAAGLPARSSTHSRAESSGSDTGRLGRRFVLGDWQDATWFLRASAGKFNLVQVHRTELK